MTRKLHTAFAIALAIAFSFSNSFAQTAVKKVILEEYTTASCGFCPMMSGFINDWQEAHSDQCIMMAIHEGFGTDAMSNDFTGTIFSSFTPDGGSFAPAMMIDRGVYEGAGGEVYLSNYNSWGSGAGPGIETIALAQMELPALCGIEITGTYNSDTRVIDATVNVDILLPIDDHNWRINLILVEDNVVGTPGLGTAYWDQSCYDPAWADDNYPGMFNGSVIIGYPHRHVMRESFFGNWGIADVIPDLPEVGATYSASASLTVSEDYDDSNLSLVAFVSRYGPGNSQKYVLNANNVEVEENFTSTSIAESVTASSFSIENIFPQPANESVHLIYSNNTNDDIHLVITDLSGKVVAQTSIENVQPGRHDLVVGTSEFSAGMYFITLQSGSGMAMEKMVVE